MDQALTGTGVEVIISATAAAVSAQLFKILWVLLVGHKINFRIFFHPGGMPSSHSACVSAMMASVGIIDGLYSTTFAIAMGVAVVVMYDAAGIRRAAGNMAGILNKMTEEFYQHQPDKLPERLRELLGHTPLQVIAGAAWGCITAQIIHQCNL